MPVATMIVPTLNRAPLVVHVEVDALLLARLDALAAHDGVVAQAVFDIHHIGRRHGLGEGLIDGPAGIESHVEFVRDHHRADLDAIAAGRAFVLFDVAGLLEDPDLEVADVSGDRT